MNISKSICKTKIETLSKTAGFFLNFWIDQERFCFLIINIFCDNEFKVANIKLDTSKRYIKSLIEES